MPSQETFDAVVEFAIRAIIGSNTSSTILHMVAYKEDNPSLVSMLINEGFDVNAQRSDGATALHSAAACGHWATCEALVAAGADYSIVDDNGNTALHHASTRNYYAPWKNLDAIKFLSSLPNAPVNEMNGYGLTPLYNVLDAQNETLAEILFKAGADPNIHSMNSDPAFFSCLSHKGRGCLAMALQYGADVNAKGRNESTALHIAATKDAPTVIKMLLDAGANPRLLDWHKRMPIHCAANNQSKKAMRQLLSFDSTLANAVDADGNTPMHYAAKNWQGDEVCRLLFEKYDADVNAKNNLGQTPLAVANTKFTIDYITSIGGIV